MKAVTLLSDEQMTELLRCLILFCDFAAYHTTYSFDPEVMFVFYTSDDMFLIDH